MKSKKFLSKNHSFFSLNPVKGGVSLTSTVLKSGAGAQPLAGTLIVLQMHSEP